MPDLKPYAQMFSIVSRNGGGVPGKSDEISSRDLCPKIF